MICKKCGREIRNDAKFCGYCGEVNEPLKFASISNNRIVECIRNNKLIYAIPFIYIASNILSTILFQILAPYGMEAVITYSYIRNITQPIIYGMVICGLVYAAMLPAKYFEWVYYLPMLILQLLTTIAYIIESESFAISGLIETILTPVIAMLFVKLFSKKAQLKPFMKVFLPSLTTLITLRILSFLSNIIFYGDFSALEYIFSSLLYTVIPLVGSLIVTPFIVKRIKN